MPTAYVINGLPAHPLLVHAVVVLLPLAALLTIVHAVWPAARARLGAIPAVLAVVVLPLVPVTVSAGHALAARIGGTAANPLLRQHERLAGQLLPWSIALAVVAIAVWVWHRFGDRLALSGRRRRAATIGAVSLAIVVGLGVVVTVVRVGDSGARATWHSVAASAYAGSASPSRPPLVERSTYRSSGVEIEAF